MEENMIELPRPSKVDGDTLRDELEANGFDRMTVFYISGDSMVFQLPEAFRDKLIALLQRHKGNPKPPTVTPEQTRLAGLESWSIGVNEALDQLLLDQLFASLSDDDLLADLGGL